MDKIDHTQLHSLPKKKKEKKNNENIKLKKISMNKSIFKETCGRWAVSEKKTTKKKNTS